MSIFLQNRDLRRSVERALDLRSDEERAPTTSSTDDRDDDEKDPYRNVPGITIQHSEDGGEKYYLVGFEGPDDPLNSRNWTLFHKLKTLFILIAIAFNVTVASSVDSAIVKAAARDFHVSEVTETLAGTGIFLIALGTGSLICSPLSELMGRWLVYLSSLILFGIWQMAAALSPNVGAQLAFRFLAGLCGAPPLTVSGGTISDVFDSREKTLAFPLFALIGFGGPILGPVMAAYIPVTGVLSWRWAYWITLISTGLVLFLVFAFKQETLGPKILMRKAQYFRAMTGNGRFKTAAEAENQTTLAVLKTNFSRPFLLAPEPIVVLMTLYLTIVYIVLFTFLDGYNSIFGEIHNLNSGLSNTIFVGLFVGVLSLCVTVPFVWSRTKRQLARDGDPGDGSKIDRESRLIFAMIGAPAIPVGLFWMGWTSDSNISIWSPIMASVIIGFGIVSIFTSAYMYVIEAYEQYAASALTMVALVRYLAAGGMIVVGVPFYKNLGVHYTLTILACIAAAVTPIPYLLYHYGPRIRSKSKYAFNA